MENGLNKCHRRLKINFGQMSLNWSKLYQLNIPKTNQELLQSCIWYNSHFSKEPLFFATWVKKGIMFVGDMITEEDTTMTLESMRFIYNVNINILHYFRIIKLIKSFTSDFKDENPIKLQHPNCPFHLQILLRHKRGTEKFIISFEIQNSRFCHYVKISGCS